MVETVIALAPVGLVLVLSEFLWRTKLLKGERGRKFIHILAGIWMAFWPFYVPFDGIFVLGAAALTLLLYSRLTRLFHAIYAVRRRTYGEILYALSLMICAYLGREPWVFTTSILFLALADGGAAVAGRLWGSKNQYNVFGYKNLHKSVTGTLTFVVLSYVCLLCGWLIGGQDVIGDNVLVVLVGMPLATTALENISPFGADNLVTPVAVTLFLNSLL